MMSERESTGHWVLDHRPMRQAEMILPEKLNQTLRRFSSGQSPKKLLIVGGAGTGKTLLAEQLSGQKHDLVALQEVESLEQVQATLASDPSQARILKRLDLSPLDPAELARLLYDVPQHVFVTSWEGTSLEPFLAQGFELVPMAPLLPADEPSFLATKEHIVKLLEKEKIAYLPNDREFMLNTRELFDKLWPNLRQIVRQTQMRCKTGNWVSTPV